MGSLCAMIFLKSADPIKEKGNARQIVLLCLLLWPIIFVGVAVMGIFIAVVFPIAYICDFVCSNIEKACSAFWSVAGGYISWPFLKIADGIIWICGRN